MGCGSGFRSKKRDYVIIDANFSAQTTSFTPASPLAGVTAVPEPAGAGLLAVALSPLCARRRRRDR